MFTPFSALSADISGEARVVDGDTIWIEGTKIRLHGIDAPETEQTCVDGGGNEYPCGERATKALTEIIGNNHVRCEGDQRDRYGRLIATCYVDGTDINAEMVLQGWALAYQRYSKDYVDEEARAMDDHAGMWLGEFLTPWDWRKAK